MSGLLISVRPSGVEAPFCKDAICLRFQVSSSILKSLKLELLPLKNLRTLVSQHLSPFLKKKSMFIKLNMISKSIRCRYTRSIITPFKETVQPFLYSINSYIKAGITCCKTKVLVNIIQNR